MGQIEGVGVSDPRYGTGTYNGAFMVTLVGPAIESVVAEPEAAVGSYQACQGMQGEGCPVRVASNEEGEGGKRIVISGGTMETIRGILG